MSAIMNRPPVLMLTLMHQCLPLSSDPSLEDIVGGIHDPGVDIPELLQGKEACCMACILENIGGGLVNGNRPGSGRWIRISLAGMNR